MRRAYIVTENLRIEECNEANSVLLCINEAKTKLTKEEFKELMDLSYTVKFNNGKITAYSEDF